MKKNILLFVFILLTAFSFTTSAQVKISGGFLGGLNLAKANVDPPQTGTEFKYLTAFAFGGVINFDFSDGLNLKLKPMYLKAGTKFSGLGLEGKWEVNYLSIPVLFTYVFQTKLNKIKPYIMAGPYLGMRLSATLTDYTGSEIDAKDLIKSTDFGLNFGAGINIPAGENTVFIEGIYSLGLTDVNNNPATTYTAKSSGIQVLAGIMFPF